MSEQKDAGVLVKLAFQGMAAMGIDATAVIERAGIAKEQLYDSQLRTPHSAQSLFWQAAEEVSADPYIGLHLGKHMPLLKGQVIEYLFFSSPTLGDGIKRMLNYQRLISDAIILHLIEDNDEAYIAFSFPEMPLRHLAECSCGALIQFLKAVSDGEFTAKKVHLKHSSDNNRNEYEKIWEAAVEFSKDENRVYFDKAFLNYRSLHAQPELFSVHEQLASQQLAQLELQDLIADVQTHIAGLLETGEINVETVAKQLNMNPRTLRSQLTEAGTSFSQVLNDYRHHLAKKLLAKTNESIAEIVYLTGFSEPSTFYRAFKRWEGITPVEYRKRKQNLK